MLNYYQVTRDGIR